jgi:hypothetical protein
MAAPSALIADAGSSLLGFGGSEGRVGDERTPASVLDAEHRQADFSAVAVQGQRRRHVSAGV